MTASYELLAIALLAGLATFIIKPLIVRFKPSAPWQKDLLEASITPLIVLIWVWALFKGIGLFFGEFNSQVYLKVAFSLIFAWFLFRWKDLAALHVQDKLKGDLLNKIGTVAIIFLTTLSLLEATGQSMGTLIAFGGVSGLAVAFAAQQTIANFFGGLMIYLTRPFSIGDWVILPEKKIEGHVEEIGWYTTHIRSMDKKPVYIPNSMFTSMVVMNPSRMAHRQIEEIVGIRYEDLPKIAVLLEALKQELGKINQLEPNPSVHLAGFGTYSLDLKISCLCQTIDGKSYNKIKETVLLTIISTIQKTGCELASPTTYLETLQPIRIKMEKHDL
jgi:MscS family membrane protein